MGWMSAQRGVVMLLLVLMGYPGKWAAAQPSLPLQSGVMLVASDEIKDGVFAQSVVLLIEHSERGSVGVVLNKPREYRVGSIAQRLSVTRYAQDQLFYGGPQQRDTVVTLIRTQRPHRSMRRVFDGVYAVTGARALVHIAEQADAEEQLRVYSGYATWAPGQLQQEIARGAWQSTPADAQAIFGSVKDLWERLRGEPMHWVWTPPSMTEMPYWVVRQPG